jgi:hypothetical protein
MKDFSELDQWSAKKLRTLRNNLNNRLSTYQMRGSSAPELQKSHMLAGLDERECKELLDRVVSQLAKIKKGE